ncbi:hypothetical protein BUALT_Bualt16G0011800 [Buddleja alternifolia]|uniref:HMA domain-containing protein n=1 Tax=Buddleja alternifolia TaxID=168488 RepID=A0AAV6WGG8_9LAMI|nr:hypothetical protein BUALT_Bualt16G0011800 [Buddleja alternifolia]
MILRLNISHNTSSSLMLKRLLRNVVLIQLLRGLRFNSRSVLRPTKTMAVAEEEGTLSAAVDQSVSVAVSPSDVLSMFFQAEGTMIDSAVPAVAKALEEAEGVTDLKVQVLEGIATVELTKQTTVQATGVASNLVEIIQGSGFKLHTLNLSFGDEEDFS